MYMSRGDTVERVEIMGWYAREKLRKHVRYIIVHVLECISFIRWCRVGKESH